MLQMLILMLIKDRTLFNSGQGSSLFFGIRQFMSVSFNGVMVHDGFHLIEVIVVDVVELVLLVFPVVYSIQFVDIYVIYVDLVIFAMMRLY